MPSYKESNSADTRIISVDEISPYRQMPIKI